MCNAIKLANYMTYFLLIRFYFSCPVKASKRMINIICWWIFIGEPSNVIELLLDNKPLDPFVIQICRTEFARLQRGASVENRRIEKCARIIHYCWKWAEGRSQTEEKVHAKKKALVKLSAVKAHLSISSPKFSWWVMCLIFLILLY